MKKDVKNATPAATPSANVMRSTSANALLDSRKRGPAAMLFAEMSARGNNFQECPVCGNMIGIIAGSKEAICRNCGFKDPCCE